MKLERSAIVDLFFGLTLLHKGIKLIWKTPWALTICLAPFILYVLIFIAGFSSLWPLLDKPRSLLNEWMLGYEVAKTFLWIFISILLSLLIFTGLSFFLYLFARVLASPFFGLLSERVLLHAKIKKEDDFNFFRWLTSMFKMTAISSVQSLVFLIIGLVLVLFSWIPFINIITSFLFLLILAYDCASYTYESLGYNLKSRMSHFSQNIMVFSGLAIALGLTILVPGLTFLMLPAAVAGCVETIGYSEKYLDKGSKYDSKPTSR